MLRWKTKLFGRLPTCFIQVEISRTTAKAGYFFYSGLLMRTWINNRPILFWTLSFVIGILLSFCILQGWWYIAVAVAVAIATVFVLLRKHLKLLLKLALMTGALLVGCLVFWAQYVDISNKEIETSTCVVSGVFTDDIYRDTKYISVVMRDCTVTLADGSVVTGKVNVRLFDEEQIEAVEPGYRAVFYGEISFRYPFKEGIDTYTYRSGVYYDVDSVGGLAVTEGNPTFAESVRKYLYGTLVENSPDTADISYALLVGDKSMMSNSDLESFRTAGIAHLLAVSGLHVGFIVGVFEFIFVKFHLHPLKRMAVLIVPLLLYAYICGFPASVMRAVTMAMVVELCRLAFRKVDLLTSLSIACALILIVRPLYLFDAGFLMSFGAVYGIATFTAATNRYIGRYVSSRLQPILKSLSVSCGATIGTLGWSLHYYGYLPLFGVVVNLVAIPIVSVAFVLTILGMIPCVGAVFLYLSDKLLLAVLGISNIVSNLNIAKLIFPSIGFAIVILGVWLFVYGGFVNFKGKERVVAHCALAILFVAVSLLTVIPKDVGTRVFVNETYGDSCVIAVHDGDVAVVSNLQYNDVESVVRTVNFRYNSLSLYVTDFNTVNLDDVMTLHENKHIDKVYVLDMTGNIPVERYCEQQGIDVVRVPKNYTVNNGVSVTSVWDGSLVGATVNAGEIQVVVVTTDNSLLYNNLSLIVNKPTALVCKNPTDKMMSDFSDSYILTESIAENNIYPSNRCGNFTLIQKDGKILLKL